MISNMGCSYGMDERIATGWDLGGAHIKVAQMDAAGRLHRAIQIPCTLWRGLEHLERGLAALIASCCPPSFTG